MGLLSRLFGGGRPPLPDPIDDPVLGRIEPGSDVDWWTATVVIDGNPIEFDIGGGDEPHPVLVARAREIARDFERFEREIRAFLERQAAGYGDDTEDVAVEIRALQIESVQIFSPERPRDETVCFHETPRGVFLWRCELVDGHPTHLGADT